MIGKRIHEEELKDTRKENYGLEIIKTLSKKLTAKYGKGFSYRNLYSFLDFFKCYPNILQTSSAQSFLSWSHYQVLLQIDDQDGGQMDMYVQMYDEMENKRMITRRLEFCFVRISMIALLDIQGFTPIISFLLQNTKFIFQPNRN